MGIAPGIDMILQYLLEIVLELAELEVIGFLLEPLQGLPMDRAIGFTVYLEVFAWTIEFLAVDTVVASIACLIDESLPIDPGDGFFD